MARRRKVNRAVTKMIYIIVANFFIDVNIGIIFRTVTLNFHRQFHPAVKLIATKTEQSSLSDMQKRAGLPAQKGPDCLHRMITLPYSSAALRMEHLPSGKSRFFQP